jgi:hypothetical protein
MSGEFETGSSFAACALRLGCVRGADSAALHFLEQSGSVQSRFAYHAIWGTDDRSAARGLLADLSEAKDELVSLNAEAFQNPPARLRS